MNHLNSKKVRFVKQSSSKPIMVLKQETIYSASYNIAALPTIHAPLCEKIIKRAVILWGGELYSIGIELLYWKITIKWWNNETVLCNCFYASNQKKINDLFNCFIILLAFYHIFNT